MSCFIDAGYQLDCRNASTGGLKAMWVLGNSGNTISGYTVSANDALTSISGAGRFYKFELVKQSSSFTEELLINDTAQSVTFQPVISVTLPKLDGALRNLFFDLVKQNELYVIVQDNNERYWFVGLQNGLLINSGSISSGQAYQDLNGATFSFQGGEPEATRIIDITTTLAAVFSGITI